MPVRSLNSAVFKWPDRDRVQAALVRWARRLNVKVTGVVKVGYIGSYAQGNWGVGSDLDVIVVVDDHPSRETLLETFSTGSTPVPVDLQVFTISQWTQLLDSPNRFAAVARNCRWVWPSA